MTCYYGVDGQVLWEAVNGAGSKEYLYLNGERLAAVQASNAHTMYHFKEHLGTLRVFSEPVGKMAHSRPRREGRLVRCVCITPC